LVVCGTVGDGLLGLRAARGEIPDPDGALVARYRLPEPMLALREPLRACADAAADVSDGLLADAGRIAEASGLGLEIHLDRLPLSAAAAAWLAKQPNQAEARLALATGGDDYALACAVGRFEEGFIAAVTALDIPVRQVGVFTEAGLRVLCDGARMDVQQLGWRHGGSARRA